MWVSAVAARGAHHFESLVLPFFDLPLDFDLDRDLPPPDGGSSLAPVALDRVEDLRLGLPDDMLEWWGGLLSPEGGVVASSRLEDLRLPLLLLGGDLPCLFPSSVMLEDLRLACLPLPDASGLPAGVERLPGEPKRDETPLGRRSLDVAVASVSSEECLGGLGLPFALGPTPAQPERMDRWSTRR